MHADIHVFVYVDLYMRCKFVSLSLQFLTIKCFFILHSVLFFLVKLLGFIMVKYVMLNTVLEPIS